MSVAEQSMKVQKKREPTACSWYVSPLGMYVRCDGPGGTPANICDMTVFNGHIEELLANVNLIAAAPDLLRSLEEILDHSEDGRFSDRDSPEFQRARLAIAKAKGETVSESF